MTRAITFTYSLTTEYRRQITAALILTVFFTAFLYAVNVYAVISRTVALQQLERQIASTESEVRSLDMNYLELSKKITPDALQKYGMKQGSVSAFIQRTGSLGRASTVGRGL